MRGIYCIYPRRKARHDEKMGALKLNKVMVPTMEQWVAKKCKSGSPHFLLPLTRCGSISVNDLLTGSKLATRQAFHGMP